MADDFDELGQLEADLRDIPAEVYRNVNKAIEVTARHIKDDWREGATIGRGYAKSYAGAISYDMQIAPEELGAEIGPVLGKTPGASAGFLEEGGPGVDGPPHHAGRDALEANEPDFYRGIEIAVTNATIDKIEGG